MNPIDKTLNTTNFLGLKKNLKKDFSAFKSMKVAILADFPTQLLAQGISGLGFNRGLDLEVWEAGCDPIKLQVLNPSSELYDFNPSVIIVFQSSQKLLGKYNKGNVNEQSLFALHELELIERTYSTLSSQLNAKIIFYSYSEIDDSVFGNYTNKIESSFLFQLRKLNFSLMDYASKKSNLYICDVSSIQNSLGKELFFQPSIYINAEMVLSPGAIPLLADKTLHLISSFQGKFKKCVIIDLDTTTWRGIIGADAIENFQIGSLGIGKAFADFKYGLKKLKNRGIIVPVCSKNIDSVAKDPFEKHLDMVLRLDGISVFMANRESKTDTLRQIQNTLNIGFDAMVFLNDNPFDRNIVRENIPEICVPELTGGPPDYLEFLYSLNLFETVSFSYEDTQRTTRYQVKAQRVNLKKNITDESDFLESLKMTSLVEDFNPFNTPIVAQLSERSNQFNLRSIRYSESEIELLSNSRECFTFCFSLADKFGDNGLICAVILKRISDTILFIDTWFMSCRVLKRGVEAFVLNTLVAITRQEGYSHLKGEYIATAKNHLVKDHYQSLGFKSQDGGWMLEANNHFPKKCYIR